LEYVNVLLRVCVRCLGRCVGAPLVACGTSLSTLNVFIAVEENVLVTLRQITQAATTRQATTRQEVLHRSLLATGTTVDTLSPTDTLDHRSE
ncbi:unnamed protein product, partial [Cochlearia groenlandica]